MKRTTAIILAGLIFLPVTYACGSSNTIDSSATETYNVKGSLAENISVLSNAQKKDDYDKAMAAYNEREVYRIKADRQSETEAKRCIESSERLIEALKEIPGTEAFIADEKKRMESVKSIMKKY